MSLSLPTWFRQEIPDASVSARIQSLLGFRVNTVCKEALCPNLGNCFKDGKLTFMLLGDTCTRDCRFCGVVKSDNKVLAIDLDEPYRIREAVRSLGLNYVVITSVTRDDLPDGGAAIFAKTIELIRGLNKDIATEVLIPDFSDNALSLKTVVDAHPCVVAHNIETVKPLYKELRPKADYNISLRLLRRVKMLNPALTTKSSIMLGLGEAEAEVVDAMKDLRRSQCDILTLGQYLAPSVGHYPVKEFISIEQFQRYRRIGISLGFKAVSSGPLVRSSYRAEEVYEESLCTI